MTERLSLSETLNTRSTRELRYLVQLPYIFQIRKLGFPGGSGIKNPSTNAGDTGGVGLILGSGSFPGEGIGNPLQPTHFSCPESPMREESGGLQSVGSQRVSYN